MDELMVSGDTSFSSVSSTGNITAGGAFYSGFNGLYINNKKAIFTNSATDNWLRINGDFSSGVYFGNSVVRIDGELQVGNNGVYLKSNSTNTTIASLVATLGSISTLQADNVNVTNVLRSARWNIQSIAQMGGSLYISPTLYFPNQGTTLTVNKSGSTLTLTITDGGLTTDNLCGFVWTANSRVKVSAKIGDVVTGTMDGVVQSINTSTHTLVLQVSGENSANVVAGNYNGSGQPTISDMSVMMYQRRVGSNDYRTGIWMNCYDNSNESATIRVYGGNDANPNVMIGNLTGAGLPAIEDTNPSGWGFYAANNAYLKGTIYSTNGLIGGWKITEKGLRKGTLGQPGSIYLVPYDVTNPTTTKATIASSGYLSDWTITSGETFGVTSDGSVYMNRGRIGNWVLSQNAFYNLNLGNATMLPSAYQQVEYVSFNLGAYLQKDFNATSGQTVIAMIRFQYLGDSSDSFYVAGDGASKNSFRLEFGHYSGNWYNGTYYVASDGNYPNQIMEAYQSKTLTADVTYNYAFGQRAGYTPVNTQTVRIWYVRIYIAPTDGDAELAYEFIPCYQKADGVIGLYETVNNEFISTNQGAGTITKGLDVVGISPTTMYPGTYVGTDRIYNYENDDSFVEIKDGVITANNAVINGNITAITGNIGGWAIGTSSLYNGTLGTANSVHLIPAGSTESATIGGSSSINNWVITVGNTFGVTKAGKLYATGAEIGNNSKIGPWYITTTSIYKGNSTYGTSGTGNMYFGDNGLSISDQFKVSNTGALTATSGAIGGISMNSSYGLYTNSKTSSTSTNSGFLISKNGAIYVGAYNSDSGACPFQVTSTGVLTATSGTIGGVSISNASGVGLYTNSKTSSTSTKTGFLISNSGAIYIGAYNSTKKACPFQVTSAGVLTANGATINGTLVAGVGSSIGPWNIDADAIYYGIPDQDDEENEYYYGASSALYFGVQGLSISNRFKVNTNGVLSAIEADIAGTLTAGSGSKIGPWDVTDDAIKRNSSSFGTEGNGKIYLGTSGISISNKFKVDNTGALTSTSGTIGNWTIGANSLSTGTYGSSGGVFLTNADMSSAKAIGGSSALSTWRFTIGANFGVTSAGALYASSANISGILTAGAGSTIGPWNVTANAIYRGNQTWGTAGLGNAYFGTNGISIGDVFKVAATGNEAGKLYVKTAYYISGTDPFTSNADTDVKDTFPIIYGNAWEYTKNNTKRIRRSTLIGCAFVNTSLTIGVTNMHLPQTGINISQTMGANTVAERESKIIFYADNYEFGSIGLGNGGQLFTNDITFRTLAYNINVAPNNSNTDNFRSININSSELDCDIPTISALSSTIYTYKVDATTVSATTVSATTVSGTNVNASSKVTAPTVSATTKVTAPTVSVTNTVSASTVSATTVSATTVDATTIKVGSNSCPLHVNPGTASAGSLSSTVTLSANARYLFVTYHKSTAAFCGVYLIATNASAIEVSKIVNAPNIDFPTFSGLNFRYKNVASSGTPAGRMIYIGAG